MTEKKKWQWQTKLFLQTWSFLLVWFQLSRMTAVKIDFYRHNSIIPANSKPDASFTRGHKSSVCVAFSAVNSISAHNRLCKLEYIMMAKSWSCAVRVTYRNNRILFHLTTFMCDLRRGRHDLWVHLHVEEHRQRLSVSASPKPEIIRDHKLAIMKNKMHSDGKNCRWFLVAFVMFYRTINSDSCLLFESYLLFPARTELRYFLAAICLR